MKAVLFENYGEPEVLKIRELLKPSPKADEILVRVHATTVTAGDVRMRRADPFAARLYNGLFKPKRVKILGFELAGVVEATGAVVTRFSPGDPVFAYAGFGFGAYAEYACLCAEGDGGQESLVAIKPEGITFEEAAAIPTGGTAALNLLRKGRIAQGDKVLINGASGSVGTYAVQIAKHFGAHVTGVCSTKNLGLVKSLGADQVIDYTQDMLASNGLQYDLIFDAAGKLPKSKCKPLLSPGGRYVHVGMSRKDRIEDLDFLASLVARDEIRVVIGRRFSLDQLVDAHCFVEKGHKRGNVIVQVVEAGA